MGLRVEVIKDDCISSGRCVNAEPAAFAFDADELGEPLPDAGELERARLLQVARNCPGQAIVVHDESGPVPLD